MQTIDNFNFAGKKAFVRVDFMYPWTKTSTLQTTLVSVLHFLP